MPLVLGRLLSGKTPPGRVPADTSDLAWLRAPAGSAGAAAGVSTCAKRRRCTAVALRPLFAGRRCSHSGGRTIGAVRTHFALEGAAYVQHKAPELFDSYNEAVYRAFWERSEDNSDLTVLGRLAESAGLAAADFLSAVSSKA